MSVPMAKKQKPLTSPDFRAGREKGTSDTIELVCAMLMQDWGFKIDDVKKLMDKLKDWQSYANDPTLAFYVSTVTKINKGNGIKVKRNW